MIAEEYIKSMRNDKYKIIIDAYVIMPDHVHMVIFVEDYRGTLDMINPHGTSNMKKHHGTSGSPSPTNAVIPRLISVFKRFTNKSAGFDLWQRSYHDHVIRDEQDYLNICQYIADNPMRWMNR